jgi:CubicO group peptidase (beta-lactamase class C family)
MQVKIKNIFLLCYIITFASHSCAQQETKINFFNFAEIDSIINNGIVDHAFPGGVLLVSKDGKIIYQNAYGHLTYDDSSAAVTTETIFDIASLTKVIATTTAAMICYDRNLFNLDDRVSKYIPAFAKNGKENVTIKNLLLHNSGLPASKQFYKEFSSADEIINDIYSTSLDYKTGTKTVYSDLGMITLAKFIEKITGERFDEFCNEEIFSPLQMNSTFFNPPGSLKYRIAPTELDVYWRNKLIRGDVHDETAYLLNGVSGNAGLFSTAEDINNLLIHFINPGISGQSFFINSKTIKLFVKKISNQSTRALGWDTRSETNSSAGNLFDMTSFGHTGFTGTSVWVDPTRNLIVVFLTNRVYPTRENKKLYKLRPLLHDAIIRAIE